MTKSSNLDDTELLSRVIGGDKISMRHLYERHAAGLSAFINQRLKDPVEAADIVHDTFIEVWTKASSFQGKASVRSWIFSIGRNKAFDRSKKLSRISLAEPDEMILDESPRPDKLLESVQDAARIRACMEALSDTHRAAISLFYFEDLTYREIAEIEAVSEGTIKTRVFHAKKLLLHCLSKNGKE